ncbi:MAG: B12-binding domain-containing protein, partial [Candidatus Methanomethylophilus sp.]|nr:B12-binding domain-containing protein [Methanomethylophilus sp.]
MEEKIEQIKSAILTYKLRSIDALVKTALDAGIAPNSILDDGMIAAMNEVGEGFKNNTIYMPQMLMAAKTMQNGLAVLKPYLSKGSDRKNGGKAVVGSVLGDVHDIGKNLVAIMLEGSGFQVTDLGADVPYQKFVEAVKADPDITVVAASSSMTPTRPALKDIVTHVR